MLPFLLSTFKDVRANKHNYGKQLFVMSQRDCNTWCEWRLSESTARPPAVFFFQQKVQKTSSLSRQLKSRSFFVHEAVNKRLNMLFPWGLWFLFFCLSGMQLSKAVLLRCSRWKIKICNGQNMGPQSPWWFVSRKPSLEMMTGAQRVATEEKCDVTLQKSSASLQNGDEASEGCFFFSLLSPSPSLFFLSCEGRHALQTEKPFIHHSDCLIEWRRWLWGWAGFSFPAISSRAWNKLDVSVRR